MLSYAENMISLKDNDFPPIDNRTCNTLKDNNWRRSKNI